MFCADMDTLSAMSDIMSTSVRYTSHYIFGRLLEFSETYALLKRATSGSAAPSTFWPVCQLFNHAPMPLFQGWSRSVVLRAEE